MQCTVEDEVLELVATAPVISACQELDGQHGSVEGSPQVLQLLAIDDNIMTVATSADAAHSTCLWLIGARMHDVMHLLHLLKPQALFTC
jgi:hypothetical protein